jgi:hypothetical protein
MDKPTIEDSLFIQIKDSAGNNLVLNKRFIASAGASLTSNTKIIMSTGQQIDTPIDLAFIARLLLLVEHKTESPTHTQQTSKLP